MLKMDSVSFELGALIKPVVDAIHDIKPVCVEAKLISVTDGSVVFLSPDSMAMALRADEPSLVFFSSRALDVHELIRSEILEAGGRETLLNSRNVIAPTIKECLSMIPDHMKARDGEQYRVSYAYAGQGLTRYCPVNTDWYDDLVNLLAEFIVGHENRFEELAANEAAKLDTLFKELAIEIANDERFVQARGLRKKGLLVEAVWGERIPRDAQSRLMRLAQGEAPQDWNFAHVVRQANDIVDQRQMLE
jgi:hypothetical protein